MLSVTVPAALKIAPAESAPTIVVWDDGPVGMSSGRAEELAAGAVVDPVVGRASLISIVAFWIDAVNALIPTSETLPVAFRANRLFTCAAADSAAVGLISASPNSTPVTERPIAPGVP